MERRGIRIVSALALAALAACSGETGSLQVQAVSSCMLCHNGSLEGDYSGPGIENPHPFTGAASLQCTECHGGNPNGTDLATSHVPPPPEIGDETFQTTNAKAYFNRLTLTGVDKFADYTVNGHTYSALDYLRFVNPGDLRVTKAGVGCGQCHVAHSECVNNSLLATETGIYSGAFFTTGQHNAVPGNQGQDQDTAGDTSFRAVQNSSFVAGSPVVGSVQQLIEAQVWAVFGVHQTGHVFQNPEFDAAALNDDVNPDGSVISGSPLAKLFQEQVQFTCGDCHLGSAGQNNRAGDFRSSGCSACHMPYSLGGKSGSADPNVNKNEPLNPDAIDEPERAHPRSHVIRGVARTLAGGVQVPGIDDATCAGCHQGSNRTVMQYWGIRLDQNADLVHHEQYPANPASFQTTHADTRLFDPAVGNHTFNGRNGNQYVLNEDYDGDGRDDTPADVHYDAGLGCVDCHGSYDLHGGDVNSSDRTILSHMEQRVAIRCESCHGTIEAYATTQSGTAWDGATRNLVVDGHGNELNHVYKDASGSYWLRSKLTGAVHYVPQTRDTVANNGKTHPTSGQPIYSAKASYAMGRVDADASNGLGPVQTGGNTQGFAHVDGMECVACHGSWTNTCMGCHLGGEYNTGNNFSNTTGERIVYKQRTADFTYQSPLFFTLGVGPRGKVTQFSANTKVFYRWKDQNNQLSRVFAFTDRRGAGANSAAGFGSLSHNAFMAHSIRGKVSATKEGPRYCATCHLTDAGLTQWGPQYDTFRAAMASRNYAALDFDLLKTHFGQNTGNKLNSPFWPHMAAGLGTGLFLFDENGCPVNPLDNGQHRRGCYSDPLNFTFVAPAAIFDLANVVYDLDRIVEASGVANGSNNHAWLSPSIGPSLRDGATDPQIAGPLGARLIRELTDPSTGIVLDSWIDSDGALQGDATTNIAGP